MKLQEREAYRKEIPSGKRDCTPRWCDCYEDSIELEPGWPVNQDTSCKVVHGSRAQYGIKGDASLALRASGRLLGLMP